MSTPPVMPRAIVVIVICSFRLGWGGTAPQGRWTGQRWACEAGSYEVTPSDRLVPDECPSQADESFSGQSERTSAGIRRVRPGSGIHPHAGQFSVWSGGPSAGYVNPRCRVSDPRWQSFEVAESHVERVERRERIFREWVAAHDEAVPGYSEIWTVFEEHLLTCGGSQPYRRDPMIEALGDHGEIQTPSSVVCVEEADNDCHTNAADTLITYQGREANASARDGCYQSSLPCADCTVVSLMLSLFATSVLGGGALWEYGELRSCRVRWPLWRP